MRRERAIQSKFLMRAFRILFIKQLRFFLILMNLYKIQNNFIFSRGMREIQHAG